MEEPDRVDLGQQRPGREGEREGGREGKGGGRREGGEGRREGKGGGRREGKGGRRREGGLRMDKVGEGRRGKRLLLANGDGQRTMVVPMKDKVENYTW